MCHMQHELTAVANNNDHDTPPNLYAGFDHLPTFANYLICYSSHWLLNMEVSIGELSKILNHKLNLWL